MVRGSGSGGGGLVVVGGLVVGGLGGTPVTRRKAAPKALEVA